MMNRGLLFILNFPFCFSCNFLFYVFSSFFLHFFSTRNTTCYPSEYIRLREKLKPPSAFCGEYKLPNMPKNISELVLGVDLPALAPEEQVYII